MAPKKKTSSQLPSSSQGRREKKEQIKRNPPTSYTNSEIKERASKFAKRKIVPSRYMSKVGLDSLGCFEIVQTLLTQMGLFNFAFTPFITIPQLVIEFLSSFCLRMSNFNVDNPYYSMRLKLGGKSYFLTKEEFDSLFQFKSSGIEGPNNIWSPNHFWTQNVKPNAYHFRAGHSKSSSFSSKPL